MAGAISTSDYTVLFLVCNHMAADRKVDRVDLIYLRSELERLESGRKKFLTHRQRLGWHHNLSDERIQRPVGRQELSWESILLPNSSDPVVNERNSRPRRQRRAPDRLNIVTTRGRSYQN